MHRIYRIHIREMNFELYEVLICVVSIPFNADPENIGSIDDPDLQEQYAAEAQRMQDTHDPDDVI